MFCLKVNCMIDFCPKCKNKLQKHLANSMVTCCNIDIYFCYELFEAIYLIDDEILIVSSGKYTVGSEKPQSFDLGFKVDNYLDAYEISQRIKDNIIFI